MTHAAAIGATGDVEDEPAARVSSAVFAMCVLLLSCLGVIAVHTSSVTTRQVGFEPIYLSRHVVHLAVAFVVAMVVATRPPEFWHRYAIVVGFAVVVALVLVLIPGVGLTAGGATRWLRLPGFSVQPSEWAKVSVPLLVCYGFRQGSRRAVSNGGEPMRTRLMRCAAIGLAVASIALTLRQPDLGTAVLLAAAAAAAAWQIGLKRRYFIGAIIALVPAAALVSLRGYQMRRITGLIETWRDWQAAPYQLKQSLIALGEGGVGGVGLGRGWQKLSFLPESHTDFVIAVVGEELGLVGIAAVAVLWVTLLLAGWKRLARCQSRFAFSFGLTLLAMLVLQAALNVAVVSAVIPPTGIPHPFLSYGGNSLLVTAVVIGICWGVGAETTVTDDTAVTEDAARSDLVLHSLADSERSTREQADAMSGVPPHEERVA